MESVFVQAILFPKRILSDSQPRVCPLPQDIPVLFTLLVHPFSCCAPYKVNPPAAMNCLNLRPPSFFSFPCLITRFFPFTFPLPLLVWVCFNLYYSRLCFFFWECFFSGRQLFGSSPLALPEIAYYASARDLSFPPTVSSFSLLCFPVSFL